MKRIALILAVVGLTLMAGAAVAQDSGLVAKGFKVGLSMHKFTGADNDFFEHLAPDLRMGLAGGAFLTFALGPNFALQPEVLYVMKGAKYEEDGNEATFKFDYLDIPILFKYRFPTAGTTRPSLFAGPVASFKLSSEYEEVFEGEESKENVDNVNGLDYGLAFGGGIDFAVGQNTITMDVRYTLGLTDWPDTDVDEDIAVKNGGWLVMVGIGF